MHLGIQSSLNIYGDAEITWSYLFLFAKFQKELTILKNNVSLIPLSMQYKNLGLLINPVHICADPGVDSGIVCHCASVSPGDNPAEDVILTCHGSTRITLCKEKQNQWNVSAKYSMKIFINWIYCYLLNLQNRLLSEKWQSKCSRYHFNSFAWTSE